MKFERLTAEEYNRSLMVNEKEEQKKVVRWAFEERNNYPELDSLAHVPNEGKRTNQTGAELKRMGLKKGFPDLTFPVARGGFHGLFIEMKMPDKKLSDDQDLWAMRLNENDYLCVGGIGSEQTKEIILSYLAGELRLEDNCAILKKYLRPVMRKKSWDKLARNMMNKDRRKFFEALEVITNA